MVALGLFLLLICGLVTAAMIVQNTEASHASVFGQAISGLTLGGLFAAGVLTGVLALLGMALMLAGARRQGRRTGLKRQVRSVRNEKESLAEENSRLQSELEAARAGNGVPDPTDQPATGRHGLFNR